MNSQLVIQLLLPLGIYKSNSSFIRDYTEVATTLGLILVFIILFIAILPRLPLGRKTHVKSPVTQDMSCLINLHCYPGCLQSPLLLPPQDHTHRVSTSSKVGMYPHLWSTGITEPALQEHTPVPYSPSLTILIMLLVMNCVESLYHMDIIYNGYRLLSIHCLKLEFHQDLLLSIFFSFNIKFRSLSVSHTLWR